MDPESTGPEGAHALIALLRDHGVTVVVANNVDDAPVMAEYLRINHRWIDGTAVGGSSFEFYVQHAAAATVPNRVQRR